MNGIGGMLVHTTGKPASWEKMLEQLKKRGPGEHGYFIAPRVCLVHTGHTVNPNTPQPLRGTFGLRVYVLVCDGELYNKEAIQKELRALGYRMGENSDAAIILQSYMAWGKGCLDKLNGAYAFAVYDGEGLFIARDRLGLKPLFYTSGDFGFLFASSVPALLCHPDAKSQLDAEGIADLMLIGPGRTPGCGVLKGIHELKPGHYLTHRFDATPQVHPYWQLKAKPHNEDFDETITTLRKLLGSAVEQQAAPGVLLSGGLDSSLMATLSKSKQTFSLDFMGNEKYFTADAFMPETDGPFIKEMVKHLHTQHHHFTMGTDDLAEMLLPAMEARGLPGMGDIDASLLFLCKNIRAHVPAALTGEGADELFGGYPWYTEETLREAETFPWSLTLQHRLSFLREGVLGTLNPEEYVRTRFLETCQSAPALYDDEPIDRSVRQQFVLNLYWFLQNLTARMETMATAAGLTLRAPFLDYRLVEYAYNIPWHMKFHQDREKGLLREAFKKNLPNKIVNRKKSPFPKTHNPAFLRKMQDMITELLALPNAPLFQFIDAKALKTILQENPEHRWYGQLMALPQTFAYFLQMNAWLTNNSIDIVE